MGSGPTQGAREVEGRQWHASPVLAFCLRAASVILPFLGAWFAVHGFTELFYRTTGTSGTLLWVAQAALLGFITSLAIDRVSRGLLPLAALYNVSLVFPDQAPSRFGIALRSGTVKKLQGQVEALHKSGLGNTEREASTRAVELIASVGLHDRLTRGHTDRVRAYVDLIAEEMGVSESDRALLAWGAMLHDVGKLKVPPEILNKQSRPTDDEWEILKSHPLESQALLEPLSGWLGDWSRAAAEHHERWDGTGYPAGLSGHEISLAGRITAVADAYDVITSKRSYKKPMSAEAARQELVRCAGTQFDPEVVRAFLNVSVGRRWLIGPLAWVTELPTVSSVLSAAPSAPAIIVGAIATAGSVALTGLPVVTEPDLPPGLALSTSTSVESFDGQAGPQRSTVPASVGSDLVIEGSRAMQDPAVDDAPLIESSSENSTTTSSEDSTTTSATGGTTTSWVAGTTTTTAADTTTTSGSVGMLWALDDATDGENDGHFNVRVLVNDTPPGGFDYSSLRIIELPQHGDAAPYAIAGDLTKTVVQFLSDPGYLGTDTFVYEICDLGGACARARATITFT